MNTNSKPSAQAPMIRDSVLKAENLSKQVSSPEGPLTIVDDVSLDDRRRRVGRDRRALRRRQVDAAGAARGAGCADCWARAARGQDLTQLDEDGRARLRAQRVGFVFQSFHLIPALTALENVMLPLELAGRGDARGGSRARRSRRVGLGERAPATIRVSSPAASSSAWRSRGPS